MYSIPFMLMRGGTSKGPFFIGSLFPADTTTRDKILLDLMGTTSEIQVDGIGGGHALANKVCLVNTSKRKDADIEYLLCQVYVDKPVVDSSIDCGNMLAAVGPFAIESGLIKANDSETKIRIFSQNTKSIIESIIQTPHGKISYAGDTKIDGVQGTGAPIKLTFLKPGGSTTGKILPTDQPINLINNIEISCVDVSMPMIIVAAESLGKTGQETKTELDKDKNFMRKLDYLRREGIKLMNLHEDENKILAKICMISSPQKNGNINARYFISSKDCDCHPTFAVTGAICLASACCVPGTLANRYVNFKNQDLSQKKISIEHPAGTIEIMVKLSDSIDLNIEAVSYIRTARLLAKGEVFVHGMAPKEIASIKKLQSYIKGLFAQKYHHVENKFHSIHQREEIIRSLDNGHYEDAVEKINALISHRKQLSNNFSPKK